MKAVFKLHADCGRMGTLEGIYVADKTDMQRLVDSKIEVYFGEVLGKHSEIFGCISDGDYTMVTDDPNVVDLFTSNKLSVGFNPFNYTTVNTEDILGDKYEDDLSVKEVLDLIYT